MSMFSDTSLFDRIILAVVLVTITIILVQFRRLEQMQKVLQELREQIPPFAHRNNESKRRSERRSSMKKSGKEEVTIFLDGAFDMTHYGHMNAFRQARALGTRLIVGMNTGESIKKHKGPTILTDEERREVLAGCVFVDEIITGVPYVMSEEYVQNLLENHKIDYIVHGDDPCVVDGQDVYAKAKATGKFLFIPRTEGVSTTDIVGRIMTQTQNVAVPETGKDSPRSVAERSPQHETVNTPARTFFPTCRMMRCFGEAKNSGPPKAGDVVVYITGDWDIYNASHVDILRKAKAYGDYLIVGVVSDDAIRMYNNKPPILNMYERVLPVLASKFVDDVVMGVGVAVTTTLIESFHIKKVLQVEGHNLPDVAYSVPRGMGILETLVPSAGGITAETIATRILENWETMLERQRAKAIKEKAFYAEKYGET